MFCYKGLVCVVVLGSLISTSALAGERVVVDRIAAVIEDEIITEREIEKRAGPFLERVNSIEDPKVREEERRKLLLKVLEIEIGEKMVSRELKSSREMLGVGEADIDRAIEEVLQMNRLTRDKLKAALYGQGMTWSEYRTKLREQIERARLIQYRVQGKVEVSESRVKIRCMDRQKSGATEPEICAAHILFRVGAGMSVGQVDELRAQASKLQAELANGADFAAYALKYSADKGAPDGALGCFGRGEMVALFEEAAYSTPVGKVSGIVQTQFGFHIIKVTERRDPAVGGCDTPKELTPFRNEIYQEEMEKQKELWISGLRKKAFVDIRL